MIQRTLPVLLLGTLLVCGLPDRGDAMTSPYDPLVIDTWTLEQQVGQLLIWGSTNVPADLKPILEGEGLLTPVPIGGVLLTSKAARPAAEVRALAAFLRTTGAAPVPPLLCADQEGGKIAALRESIRVAPSHLALSALSLSEVREYAYAMALDTKAAGIDVLLAPVVDVEADLTAPNPAIGKHERSFGADPWQVAELAQAFCEGVWDAGAVPVLKHFPGHGTATTDSHLVLPRVDLTEAQWREREAIPYSFILHRRQMALAPPPIGVMVGHLDWPALTNGEGAASLSRTAVTTLLREGFGLEDAVIVSDDIHMKALQDPVQSAIAMRRAGVDLILVSHTPSALREIHRVLVKFYREGWLDRQELRASLERILLLKQHLAEHWVTLVEE